MPQEIQTIINQIANFVGDYIPRIAGALAILIIGWLVAIIISAIVRRVLRRTDLDNRLHQWLGGGDADNTRTEELIARGVYYLILVFVLVATLEALQITVITVPVGNFLNTILGYAPQLIGAAILILIAWLVARIVKFAVAKGLTAMRVDERVGEQVSGQEGSRAPLATNVAEAAYWLVLLLFLPAILGALGLSGLLAPVQGTVDGLIGFLPNLLGAAIILVVGWFVASIVRRIVTSLLAAAGADSLAERVGLSNVLGQQRLSGLIGLIVYALIFIPVVIGALEALALQAITQPASNMLNTILGVIPDIFAAALILVIAYIVGRVVAGLISSLLAAVGFNNLPVILGVGQAPVEGQRTPADYVGWLVLAVIMFFAVMEAVDVLGFMFAAELVSRFITFASQIIFGLVIIAIGLFLANLAARAIRGTGLPQATLLSWVARIAILVLTAAIGLRMMGIANEIIMLAFGIPLAAIAIAVAIAFGVGSRQIAARELDNWIQGLRGGTASGTDDGDSPGTATGGPA
jgi:hypothetical protein